MRVKGRQYSEVDVPMNVLLWYRVNEVQCLNI